MNGPLVGSRDGIVGRDDIVGDLELRLVDGLEWIALVGPAGVGKTTVALEVAARASTAGRVVVVHATPASYQFPFGALGPLLGPMRQPADVERDAIDQVARAVAADADRVAVVVDDWNLLDDASCRALDALDALADVGRLTTVRSDDPGSAELLAAMRHNGWKVIDLEPLDRTSTVDLATQLAAGDLDESTADELWLWSRGNPLFVVELIASAAEAGLLVDRGGRRGLVDNFPMPGRIADIVAARVARLGEADRSLLAAVAVAGDLPVNLAEAVGSSDSLTALIRRGMLRPMADRRGAAGHDEERIKVGHPLVAEAVRRGLSPVAVTTISRRLAEASQAIDIRADVLRAAYWHEVGGVAAPPWLWGSAGRRARRIGQIGTAERFARHAVHGGGGTTAEIDLAEIVAAGGDADGADAIFAKAQVGAVSALAACSGTDADAAIPMLLLGYVGITRMFHDFWALGDATIVVLVVSDVTAALDRAAASRPGLRPIAAAITDELLAERAVHVGFGGRFDEGLDMALDVLSEPRRQARGGTTAGGFAARAETRARLAAASALLPLGRPDEAAEHLRQGLRDVDAVPSAGHGQFRSYLLMTLAEVEIERGNPFVSAELAELGFEESVGDASRQKVAEFARGRAALALGRLDEATGHFSSAIDLDRSRPTRGGSRWYGVSLALALGVAGRAPDAKATLDALGTVPAEDDFTVQADYIEAQAWQLVANGELPAALRVLESGHDRARAMNLRAGAAWMAHELVRLRGSADDIARMLTSTSDLDQGVYPLLRRHARALREGPAALRAVAAEFAERGWALQAADAARATAEADRRRRGPRDAAAMTKRQRQIAALAASGLSNADVAARLGISTRTVANQLQRVYASTGVTRRQLSDVL